MRQHILLPTDFSENAWSAALYAIKLYAKTPTTFYFLHAWTFVNLGSRNYITPNYIDTLQDAAKVQLDALKERAQFISPNTAHTFETIFSKDFLSESITTAIKDHDIDLIIMGTKGATGAKEFLLGSNSVSVIKKIKRCPVLLVPNNYEYETPKHIAFATDFYRPYGDELNAITKLAKSQKSQIEILHIREDNLTVAQNKNLMMLARHLEAHSHNFNWIPSKGTKEQIISTFIEKNKINLITMINYEHSLLEDLLNEPIIKKLGFHSPIPFMVIPHQGVFA